VDSNALNEREIDAIRVRFWSNSVQESPLCWVNELEGKLGGYHLEGSKASTPRLNSGIL
jgi:DNA gyrase/topoisomerase IV subunit B